MFTGYVYKITNQINSKVYIGITTGSIEQRFKIHSSLKSGCKALTAAILKHGTDNFSTEVLETHCAPEFDILWNKLCYREQVNIAEHNSFGEGGYNLTLGGEGYYLGKDCYSKRYRDSYKEWNMNYKRSRKDIIKEQSKKYYDTHRDSIIKYNKEYYYSHKEEINIKGKEKRFLKTIIILMVYNIRYT